MSKDWTPEQLDNAMKYGLCLICRAPRELSIGKVLNKTALASRHGEPKFVDEMRLICPNGHQQ